MADSISIELVDTMTVGALRAIAQQMGKRLVIDFAADGKPVGSSTPAKRGRPASSSKPAKRPRRKLSPEARAALARNLVKARAARAAKKAAR